MKKRLLAVMLCVSMLGAALTGCGSDSKDKTEETSNNKDDDNAQDADADAESENTLKGYVFEADGVKIAVDMDMSEVEAALGEPSDLFDQPSCAAQGTAYFYTYSGFEIDTYPDGEKNMIACILLKDDTVATAEGIDLSKTKADIIAAYGEDYEEKGTALVYEKDGMTLSFIMDGENIASIEYTSSVLN